MRRHLIIIFVGVLAAATEAVTTSTDNPLNNTESTPQSAATDHTAVCLDRLQLLAFQEAIKSLTNDSDHMTDVLHHMTNLTNEEADNEGTSRWLSLLQLQESIKKLLENSTQDDDQDEIGNVSSSNGSTTAVNKQACSYGIAIFTLWAQVQKLKKAVEELQHNREYYTIQLKRFTFLENNINLVNKQLHLQANNITSLSEGIEEFAAKYDSVMDALEKQLKATKASENENNVIKPSNKLHVNEPVDIYLSHAAAIDLHNEIETVHNATTKFEEHIRYIEEGHTRQIAEIAATLNNLEIRLNNQQPGSDHSQPVHQPITRATCNGERRHQVGNSCYYVPKLLMEPNKLFTWWDARYFCRRPDILGPDADLVVIETEEEMEQIIEMMLNHFGGIEEFWLGGNDLGHEGTWRWLFHDEPFNKTTYTNWARSPPVSTSNNCMAMLQGYDWVDEPCYYQRNPFCEVNLND